MAAVCYTCDKGIMNNEFVGCAGVCGEIFHLKCVAVSCNEGNRHISAAIKNIDDSIARLTTSLSGDLMTFLDGLRTLMDNLLSKVVTISNIPSNTVDSKVMAANPKIVATDPKVIAADPESIIAEPNVIAVEPKVIATDSKVIATDPRIIAANRKVISDLFPPVATDHRTKSIVVSNIAKDVSVDCLRNYLLTKLGIEKTKIQLALLLPIGRASSELRFLQYKVTIPDDNYSSIMSPSLWPQNVRLRDFIDKENKRTVVSKENFAIINETD